MSDTSILDLLVNLRYHLIQYTGGTAAATSPENQKPCLRIILTGTGFAQFTLYIWKPLTDGIPSYFRTDDSFSLTIWVRFPACLENVEIWRVKYTKGCLAQWQRIALVIGWSGFDSRRNQIFRPTELVFG